MHPLPRPVASTGRCCHEPRDGTDAKGPETSLQGFPWVWAPSSYMRILCWSDEHMPTLGGSRLSRLSHTPLLWHHPMYPLVDLFPKSSPSFVPTLFQFVFQWLHAPTVTVSPFPETIPDFILAVLFRFHFQWSQYQIYQSFKAARQSSRQSAVSSLRIWQTK